MKVLQINIRVNKGSVSRITEQIGIEVLNQGWESYIAYGRPSNPSKSQLIQIGTYWGVKFHYLMSQLTGKHGHFSTNATKKLVKRIKEIKPDIIHLQNIHGYYINYKVLFEYLNTTNIPIVWTLHDCWSFTGHCSHFITVGCEKWKTGCYSCSYKILYPRSLVFDWSKDEYKLKKKLFTQNKNIHFVPVSHWLEGLLKQSYFKDYDIRVIHNGIDLNVFKPCDTNKNERFQILGVASIWSKGKGLYDIFKLRQLLDINKYEITLVGLNDNQMKELPAGINGVKRTDSVQELAEFYASTDAFVNLTYADTFPTVNLEALACGTPVITYRTGGSPETIDEQTGIVVEQGNLNELIEAIERIRLMTPEEKKLQRERCRKRAENNYEKNKCYKEYISLYKSLTSEKKI